MLILDKWIRVLSVLTVIGLGLYASWLFLSDNKDFVAPEFKDQVHPFTESTHPLTPQRESANSETGGGKALAGLFALSGGSMGFHNVPLQDAQSLFQKQCTTMVGKCEKPQRFGRTGDGGYEVCMSGPYNLTQGKCVVYSFGIGQIWDFDDALQNYGCEVHSFDPSIGLKDHTRAENHHFYNLGLWDQDTVNENGWELNTLDTIMKKPGHERRVIDVVKVDIEGAEWPPLRHWLKTSVLSQIKQLIFEIHTPVFTGSTMTVQDYASIYNDLAELREKWGYQLYMEHHANWCCGRFAPLVPPLCCYELYFINSNFMQ